MAEFKAGDKVYFLGCLEQSDNINGEKSVRKASLEIGLGTILKIRNGIVVIGYGQDFLEKNTIAYVTYNQIFSNFKKFKEALHAVGGFVHTGYEIGDPMYYVVSDDLSVTIKRGSILSIDLPIDTEGVFFEIIDRLGFIIDLEESEVFHSKEDAQFYADDLRKKIKQRLKLKHEG